MRDEQTIAPEVRQVMAAVLGIGADEIDAGTTPESVERWDSLQHITLVLSLQDAFDVTFEPEEIVEMLSYEAILAQVKRKLG